MKQIVVYESKTGFTKQYAQWISQELACECISRKEAERADLNNYDRVIYGGWLMAGRVCGLDKMKKQYAGKMTVYAVGMMPVDEEAIKRLISDNQLLDTPFFYYQGGYRPEKLNFAQKMIMNTIKKSIEKKAEKTAADLEMLETFAGRQRICREAIKELINGCQTNQ